MQDAVKKIQALGVPPEGFEDGDGTYDEATCQLWEDWVDAVDAIRRPVTWEEAEVLVRCCPTDHMAEVEWTMLHCIESAFAPDAIEPYRNLIETCNSEMMKEMLLTRLQNYIQNHKDSQA